jgi:polar amino acid transport system substrate-binding protein
LIVSKDSAYDLYLSRVIKNATIIRAPSCGVVVETFLKEGYEVAGGVTQAL